MHAHTHTRTQTHPCSSLALFTSHAQPRSKSVPPLHSRGSPPKPRSSQNVTVLPNNTVSELEPTSVQNLSACPQPARCVPTHKLPYRPPGSFPAFIIGHTSTTQSQHGILSGRKQLAFILIVVIKSCFFLNSGVSVSIEALYFLLLWGSISSPHKDF